MGNIVPPCWGDLTHVSCDSTRKRSRDFAFEMQTWNHTAKLFYRLVSSISCADLHEVASCCPPRLWFGGCQPSGIRATSLDLGFCTLTSHKLLLLSSIIIYLVSLLQTMKFEKKLLLVPCFLKLCSGDNAETSMLVSLDIDRQW